MNRKRDREKFDLLVIGGGAAGLVSSGMAAKVFGMRTGLVSDGHPGGECLWTGCVPTKALIHYAELAQAARKLGLEPPDDLFGSAMKHMRDSIERIKPHDSPEKLETEYGVKVISGRARFLDPRTIQVADTTLKADRFIIATGGTQSIPDIEGFDKIGCLTHESILSLRKKPERLLIVGGGPVGVEFAQMMTRLGCSVSLIQRSERLLPREEPETSSLVEAVLRSDGVEVLTSAEPIKAIMGGTGESLERVVTIKLRQEEKQIECDEVLVATGKTPATKQLNLGAAGVSVDSKGFVKVDDSLRTTAPNIWACGDVCGLPQFTHYADHLAQVAATNASIPMLALLVKREKVVIPWCTFIDPEIARVGLSEEEARSESASGSIFALHYGIAENDRAIIDQATRGFIKIIVDKSGKIYGATVAAPRAGELIHELALAMKAKRTIADLSRAIHAYPTMSTAVRDAAILYYEQVIPDSNVIKAARLLSEIFR